jgi:2-oxoglutarate/2-oxoacid ferredoxin oxidoreductase subunit alpha
MRLNILIGGKAGQGINFVSKIVAGVLSNLGYFTFNYRDYQSLIRGGHNFNVLGTSDLPIESIDSKVELIVALDEHTLDIHKDNLKKDGIILKGEEFRSEGKNLNIALSGVLIKILGIPFEELEKVIAGKFKNSGDAIGAARKGYDFGKENFHLKKLEDKNLKILSGSEAVAIGARGSGLDLYIGYPMTPATNAFQEMATDQIADKCMVFQAENEISAAMMALGASFSGAKVMTGTSGGGFDLMGESLSFQGMSEIPLVVYLASRSGPGSGVPTYTSQADLDVALRSGHGDFPRFVIAPSNPIENINAVSESLFLSEKFKTLSILFSDKHLAESEFSSISEPNKPLLYSIDRKIPGDGIVRASSYESTPDGISTEDADITKKNADARIKKYNDAKNFIKENMEMIKIHGKEDSKNLVIGFGSTSGAVKDAIQDLDAKFLQVIYVKPLSDQIKEEMQKAENIILVEGNVTGQLGRLLREKTGISIKKRILKYDGRPFFTDELKAELGVAIKNERE